MVNRGILLKTDLILLLDGAQSLLTYKGTVEAPVNENTCKHFKSGHLVLKEAPLPTKHIGYCKNFESLRIDFDRPADTAAAGNEAYLMRRQLTD